MRRLLIAAALLWPSAVAQAQESNEELAKKLSNPVANLVSVPFQFNYDCCIGPSDGGRYLLNVQPVIPFSVSDKWNVIVRTILPIIDQESTSPTTDEVFGIGDTTQSFFFSPKETFKGWTWAIGPAFLWPTGSGGLSAKKWGAGPTALLLHQHHGYTYGVLANHIWSFADAGRGADRPEVNQTFVQPFFSWTSPTSTTLGINSEATYNWKSQQWSIPVNLTVTHIYTFGGQRVSLGGGLRVYAAADGPGPDWGLRLIATFLFPK